jgi:dolichol kinase
MFRKLYHLGGLIFPVLLFSVSRNAAIYTCGGLFLLVLFFDLFRLQWKELNFIVIRKLPIKFKRKEVRNISGSPYFLGGVFLTLVLFKPEVAAGGIIYLSIGDMAAVTVGKKYGKIKIFKKTLEGSVGFVIASTCVLLIFNLLYPFNLSMPGIIAGAVICAVIEVLPLRIDDNLLIPIFGAFILRLLG